MVGGMKIISNKKHRKLIWSKVHAKKNMEINSN